MWQLVGIVPMMQMAVALDPRYKKLTFLRRAKGESVWPALSNAFRAFYDRKHRAGRPTEEQNNETRSPVPKKRKTYSELPSNSESQSSVHSAESELMQYHEEAPIPERERILHVVET